MKCTFCDKEFDFQMMRNNTCPNCDAFYQYLSDEGTYLKYFAYPHFTMKQDFENTILRLQK